MFPCKKNKKISEVLFSIHQLYMSTEKQNIFLLTIKQIQTLKYNHFYELKKLIIRSYFCLRNQVNLNFPTTVLVNKICIFNISYHILFTFVYQKQKQETYENVISTFHRTQNLKKIHLIWSPWCMG
jgi:hypothetical protein